MTIFPRKREIGCISCIVIFALVCNFVVSLSSSNNMSSSGKKAALVFLHGLGDTPAGWSMLENQLPAICPRLSELMYSFPKAPTIGITINGGMEMPGWFDLYDWPIAVGSKDDKDGLLRSVKQIQDEITRLETEHEIPRERIVVGGFSQGGAVALLAAYHNKNEKPLAGCVALSAWLTLQNEIAPSTKTPLFWGHGQYDDKVLFDQQSFGLTQLQEKGLTPDVIESADYPMGHSSHPKEIQDFANYLDNLLFNDKTKDES